MKSGPVLLLLIAFAVLYLAATGRLSSLAEWWADPDAGMDGEASAGDASVPAAPGDINLPSVQPFIGGRDGLGYMATPNGWTLG